MNREKIYKQVIQCLRNVAPKSNDEPIDEKTNPMLKFGLDSHDGVNLACVLSEQLSCEVPVEVNPLVDDERNRARSVGEITDLISQLLVKQKEEPNG